MNTNLENAIKPFIDKGFIAYESNQVVFSGSVKLLQKRIKNSLGTPYFVNVTVFDFTKFNGYTGSPYQFELNFDAESEFIGKSLSIKTAVTTPEEALNIAEQLFDVLSCRYYELNS